MKKNKEEAQKFMFRIFVTTHTDQSNQSFFENGKNGIYIYITKKTIQSHLKKNKNSAIGLSLTTYN